MFKFEGYCDDKYVVAIMKAIAGHALDFKMVPVANAQAKNGKVVAKVEGDMMELLTAYIKQHKLTTVTPLQLRTFLVGIGRSPGSYSSILQKAIGAKMLKYKSGASKNRTYMVLK